jgi:uncharacterized membrane protein
MATMTPWIESLIDKTVHTLKDDTIKKKIQILILEPFIQYMIELIFPYMIIMCVVFAVLVALLISILWILMNKSS